MKKSIFVFLLCLEATWASTPNFILDNAKYFTPDIVSKANEEILKIKKQFKASIIIETASKVPLAENAENMKQASPEFMAWAKKRLSKAGENNIYIVISREPSYVMAAVGSEMKKKGSFTEQDRNILIKVLADNFQQNNFNGGILQGIQFAGLTLDNFSKGTPNQYQFIQPDDPSTKQVALMWRWIGFGCAALLAVLLISGLIKGFKEPTLPKTPENTPI